MDKLCGQEYNYGYTLSDEAYNALLEELDIIEG